MNNINWFEYELCVKACHTDLLSVPMLEENEFEVYRLGMESILNGNFEKWSQGCTSPKMKKVLTSLYYGKKDSSSTIQEGLARGLQDGINMIKSLSAESKKKIVEDNIARLSSIIPEEKKDEPVEKNQFTRYSRPPYACTTQFYKNQNGG